MKTKLNDDQIETLQRLIVKEHLLPDCEQFGHLEYMCQYTIANVKYLFHNKALMGVEVYRIDK